MGESERQVVPLTAVHPVRAGKKENPILVETAQAFGDPSELPDLEP